MPIHNKNTFIRDYSNGDNLVIIQDVNNSVTYEIKPWHLNSMYVLPNSNDIIIKMKGSDYNPKISFNNYTDAIEALTKLQISIDLMKGFVDNIPDEIKTYVDNSIFSVNESSKFTFRQSIASENWFIYNHEMDKFPSVTITDDNFNVINGSIKYLDSDNIDVKFNVPLTGWVFLN